MNRQKGQLTIAMGTFITTITLVASVIASYYTTINRQDVNAVENKTYFTDKITDEKNARMSDTSQMQGQITIVNNKVDTMNEKLDAIINGLGIKYSLPRK